MHISIVLEHFAYVPRDHAERNPDFRKEALEKLPKNKTIAVMCSLGGTILVGTKPREMSGKVFKSDPDRAFGRESRSLKACYELYEVRYPQHFGKLSCKVL